MKHLSKRRLLWVWSAASVLILAAALYVVCSLRSLRSELADAQARLALSEEARINDLYDLQREIGPLRQERTAEGGPSAAAFVNALRNGEIESVLILGDSISDGNGDNGCIYSQSERAELGLRPILTDGEETFYENAPQSQGWVRYFRDFLLENTSVSVFHNNAIGGKSAKWFNAHKEQAVSRDYDAIIVMLGTNDRWAHHNTKEFYVEYAALLSYLESRCGYLQVLTPVPAFHPAGADGGLTIRQIADTVLALCADKGYSCIDLYDAFLKHARTSGMPLECFYYGGTHPNPRGYLAMWRLIAGEFGLILDMGDTYDMESCYDIVSIGDNREEVTEEAQLYDTFQGKDIYPPGISFYWSGGPFITGSEYGGPIVTYRYESGGGKQIGRRMSPDRYDMIRRAGDDGIWGEWQVLYNR